MSKIEGSTVLITGAASGMGRLLSVSCVKKKAKCLILWDLNEEQLNQVAQELSDQGVDIVTDVLDLSSCEAINVAVKKCVDSNLIPDIIINNAGIVVGKNFIDHSQTDIEVSIAVNTMAPMYITRAFLPAIINNGKVHIVNVSSAASLLGVPRMSVYCASKWGLVGWSDSLRLELQKTSGGKNFKVMTVMPYYVNTGMFHGVSSPILPILKPEYVVEKIVKGIEKNKLYVKVPRILYFFPLIKAVLPVFMFDFVVGKIFGIYTGMEPFQGRKKQ